MLSSIRALFAQPVPYSTKTYVLATDPKPDDAQPPTKTLAKSPFQPPLPYRKYRPLTGIIIEKAHAAGFDDETIKRKQTRVIRHVLSHITAKDGLSMDQYNWLKDRLLWSSLFGRESLFPGIRPSKSHKKPARLEYIPYCDCESRVLDADGNSMCKFKATLVCVKNRAHKRYGDMAAIVKSPACPECIAKKNAFEGENDEEEALDSGWEMVENDEVEEKEDKFAEGGEWVLVESEKDVKVAEALEVEQIADGLEDDEGEGYADKKNPFAALG